MSTSTKAETTGADAQTHSQLNGMTPSQRFLYYAPPSASWGELSNWWARLDSEGLV